MSQYFLDNNVRQRLVHEIDKLHRSVNSMLFCHYGLFDRSLHTVKASRDFVDNRLRVLNISLDFVDSCTPTFFIDPGVHIVYILREFSLFTGFAAASYCRDRFAIHFDRWPRLRLVFQDSGLQLRALRISTLSPSLFSSPGKLSRPSPGSNFRFVRIRGGSIREKLNRSTA